MKKVLVILAVLIILPWTGAKAINIDQGRGSESAVYDGLVITQDATLWDLNNDPPEKILGNVSSVSGSYALCKDDSLWNIKKDPPEKILDNVSSVSGYYAFCNDNSLWNITKDPAEKVIDNAKSIFNSFVISFNGDLWDISEEPHKLIMNNIKSVTGSRENYFAIREDGTLWAWGTNSIPTSPHGAVVNILGTGIKGEVKVPVKIMDNVKTVETVGYRTMVITENDELWGWGDNSYRQMPLGDAPYFSLYSNTPAKLLDNIKEIYIEVYYSYILDNYGYLSVYGSDTSAISTFYGDPRHQYPGSEVSIYENFGRNVDTFARTYWRLTSYPIAILKNNGMLWNYTFDTDNKNFSAQKIDENVRYVYESEGAVFYIKEDASLWCFGECRGSGFEENAKGILGDEKNVKITEPVKVLDDVAEFSQRFDKAYAIKTDGSLWMWGYWPGILENATIDTPTKIFDNVRIDDKVRVYVNGVRVEAEEAYIKDDRTFIPMRVIFEALGAKVEWDNEAKCAIAVKNDTEVKIVIGEAALYKNGERIELDTAAEIVNDRTMVPVRAISEAFGAKVDWKNETKSVVIETRSENL